ncbi:MAG: hypothetical protein N2Z70_06440 [Bdellovibrionaceae bacterium]|jgi:hypothetical protein|nr:hypothetical protein [Pseudobdellovibrionaceae bacterium]
MAWAKRLHLSLGAYSMKADLPGGGNFSLTRLGSYQLAGDLDLSQKFVAQIAYSLVFSRTLGGDMGFGPGLRFLFYPQGRVDRMVIQSDYLFAELWQKQAWFLSAGFHQMQFQSTESSYAGASVGGGFEWLLKKGLGALVRAEYQSLRGPNQIQLQYLDVSGGLSFYFD